MKGHLETFIGRWVWEMMGKIYSPHSYALKTGILKKWKEDILQMSDTAMQKRNPDVLGALHSYKEEPHLSYSGGSPIVIRKSPTQASLKLLQ